MSYGSFPSACLHYMFYKFPEMILIVFIITKNLKDLGGGEVLPFYHTFYTNCIGILLI